MSTIAASVALQRPLEDDEDRKVVWLYPTYSANKWTITDDDGRNHETIDFDFQLANGRSLIHCTRLLAAAKEALFWLRILARKMTAAQQRRHWVVLRNIIHAASLYRIRSLSEITFSDLRTMCHDLVLGVDAFIRASQRLSVFLAQYKSFEDIPDGLLTKTKDFAVDEVLRACAIPLEIKTLPYVARVFSKERTRLGMRTGKQKSAKSSNTSNAIRSSAYISNYHFMLYFLYDSRQDMRCETFIFNPREASKDAQEGKSLEKTRIVPDRLAFSIIEASTRWIVREGRRPVEHYLRVCRESAAGLYNHDVASEARLQIRYLVVAGFVTILSLTGRRKSEILTLRRNCLAGNDGYGWWLRTKVLKKGRRVETWIPIPGLVARVLQTIISLSADVEGLTDEDLLFAYYDVVLDRGGRLRPHILLQQFAAANELVDYVDDQGVPQKWVWESRQFRRFFAIIFFYQYGGSLQSLNHALRHDDLNTTRGYLLLESDLAALYRQEEYRFKRRIMLDIANDNGDCRGAIVNKLKRYSRSLKKVLRENLTVLTGDEADFMLRYAAKEAWVITPKRWVTCFCPLTAAAAQIAGCRSGQAAVGTIGPAFDGAGPSVCGQCPHGVVSAENREYVCNTVLAEISTSSTTPPRNLFEELQQANFIKIDKVYASRR